MTDTTEYLYTLRCEACDTETTYAYEAAAVPVDQAAPWPDAAFCPACGEAYPDDLGAQTTAVREAWPARLPELRGEDAVCGPVRLLWAGGGYPESIHLSNRRGEEFTKPTVAHFETREQVEQAFTLLGHFLYGEIHPMGGPTEASGE